MALTCRFSDGAGVVWRSFFPDKLGTLEGGTAIENS